MWFIKFLVDDPQLYFFWIVTVVISIVCHELAHGYMAIHRGDPTPERAGHITGNPLVHMGPFSLAALFLVGIAWGQMPIDPTRMRGKFAEALVAVAGPLTNLLLALLALTALGVWWHFNPDVNSELQRNLARFLMIFGTTNILLCLFNLFPVPPLDGSHILANFYRPYAMLISDPAKQQIWFFAFIGVFIFSGGLITVALKAALNYTALIAADPYVLDFASPF